MPCNAYDYECKLPNPKVTQNTTREAKNKTNRPKREFDQENKSLGNNTTLGMTINRQNQTHD